LRNLLDGDEVVALEDMSHLVRQHAGQLRLCAKETEQTPGHENVTAGRGKSVVAICLDL
jgi:hypothetical protein